ncbi:MAG: VWA domain-containing protein, partial [Phycisphaeraceae bacterium]
LDDYRRWTAIGLRLAALMLIVFMLADLQAVQNHEQLTVIAAVDQSESVRQLFSPPVREDASEEGSENGEVRSAQQWVRAYLRSAAAEKRGDDLFGMVTFDGKPRVRVMPDNALMLDPGTIDQPNEGTDAAAALQTAMALFPPNASSRLVLVTDGTNQAGGDAALLAAAREARAAGIAVDVLPIEYQVDNEVVVESLHAPNQVRRGESVALRVVLRSTRPTRGTLQILHDDVQQDLNGPDAPGQGAPVARDDWTREDEATEQSTAGQYVAVKQIELPMHETGANRFEAVFEPAARQSDAITVNNRAQAFTQVAGQGKVLFVDNVGGDSGMILPRALQQHGVELEIVNPAAIPTRLSDMQRYDALVLQNVPADQVTGAQQRMLTRYVHDLGGGLVMLGGPDSFGAGGWNNSPIEKVMPIAFDIPQQTVMPSGALALVIDRSGSMAAPVGGSGKSQMELASEAAVLALETLYPQDMVSVVAFDSSARAVVEMQMNRDPVAIAQRVRSLQSGGGTNIYAGLEMARDQLADLDVQDTAIKHVLLLSDGESTPPPGGSYVRLVGEMRKAGITVSTVGVGDAHNSSLLQRLADMGDGRYHPIQNPNNLPQVFIKEARTIRKNLIKEQTFQPNLHQTGSPIMTGLSATPELRGFVLTGRKHDPRIFMPITGPEDEPIFAHWQVGLGRSAAFTSDATNRWATDWLQWGGYADFWARTMRAIARPARGRNLDLVTTRDGDQLRVRLDATAAPDSEDAGFSNFLNVQGSIIKPDGDTETVTLQQTGPGVYETTAPAEQTGNYIVSLLVQQPDGTRQAAFGGATKPPGEELRHFRSNTGLLRQVAEITGGRWLEPSAQDPPPLFDRSGVTISRSIRPLWRTLLMLLLLAFLLDVASRRIAWDPVAIVGWLRLRIGAVLGALKPRQVQTEPTLGALKNRRTATAQKLNQASQPQPEPAPASPQPAAPPPSRQRKFEASPDAQAATDFTDAIGGARADTHNKQAAAKLERTPDEEPADTTNRLRAAKLRARQNLKDERQ